ncbi:MAG: hypothetical protein Q4D42_08105 [Eubacteriales bacterium]|nr:hypothetical protein [Eubacteriales bacterium]
MKKAVIALSLCCITLFSFLMYQQFSPSAVPAADAISAEEQTEEQQPLYLVREHNGVLAIYPYGSDTAAEVTDIRLSSLREYDQKLMEHGFPLYSDQELASFLEDFGS